MVHYKKLAIHGKFEIITALKLGIKIKGIFTYTANT